MTFIKRNVFWYKLKNIITSIVCFAVILSVFKMFMSEPVREFNGTIIKGTASWYSEDEELDVRNKWGGFTANGEKFDDTKMTCAISRDMMNKWYKVTNLENGKSVVVWANDTGSFKKLGRVIDLSKSAFAKIADLDKGLIKVKVVSLQE